jgi:hypothetical protein
MKGTPEEVLKAIPDFEDFTRLAEEISALMYKKLSLDASIKDGESNVFKVAGTDDRFFQGGKPPSSTAIDNTYKYPGLHGELLPLRQELAKVTADLEGKKLQYDVYKQMVEIWRTLCSNQRSASI